MDPNQYALMQGAPQQPGMQMPGQPPGMPPGGVMGPGAPMPVPGQPQQPPLDPAMIQAMLGLQGAKTAQAGVARQRGLADQLRADARSQSQGRQAGRVYQGPGVLNAIAGIAGGLKSKRMGEDADLKEQNIGAQRGSALQDYFNSITGQKRPALPHMGDEGE